MWNYAKSLKNRILNDIQRRTTFIDIDKVEGNIFDLIKTGQEYIRKNIIWNVKITDKREEYPEIPLDSIREAIINSYAHRLYQDPKGTEISIFKNNDKITKNDPVNVELNITEESILRIIMKNPKVTQISIANKLDISEKTVKRNIAKLKEKGIIKRIGADKNGYWKVL